MKRLKVIACEVAFRELCLCASQSNNIIDFTFMPRKLHIVGDKKMQQSLQDEIDKVDDSKYDAILLAYGLCGCGVVGLKSKLPIVIPKADNCVSFFLGSKEKYTDIKTHYPKAFYFTSGWLEREIVPNSGNTSENFASYKSMIDDVIFINNGVGNIDRYKKEVEEISKSLKTSCTEIDGDNSLLLNLLNGDWNENDFTVVLPNHQIIATNDDNIIGYK